MLALALATAMALTACGQQPAANNSESTHLHPRWNEDGSMISFDSTHEGQRGVYVIDMEAVKEEFA